MMKTLRNSIWLLVLWFLLCTVQIVGATAPGVNPRFTAISSDGAPWYGAKLYTYVTGTTTPKTTWTDSTKGTPNANPVTLDQYGQADVWLDSSTGGYRLRLVDPEGVEIWTKDSIYDSASVASETVAGLVRQSTDAEIEAGSDVTAFVAPDQFKKYNGVINSVSALKLRRGYDGEVLYLRGYYTYNDGGQGPVVWNAASTATADNGIVFSVTGVATGRWIRQYEYLTPDMFGGILTAGPEIHLLPKTYTLDSAKIFTDSVYKISGTLAVNTVAGVATSSASGIDAGAYAISFGSAKTSFGLDLSGFLLSYSGAGTALTVDDFINTNIHELFIDCNSTSPYGINLTGNSFFSLLSNVTISRFTNTGLILNSVGTKAVVRDCNISSSQATAVAAIEVNTAGVTIQDGQADIGHAGDNTGIGVFFNNETGATIAGGIVDGTLFEADTGIKITGTTHAFTNVVIRNTRHTIGSGQLGVVFDRAYNCVMENPTVVSPTGGTIATWGEHSIKCGLVGGFDACRAGISVHGSATQAYKICNEPILYSERSNITTAANLTTTVEDCQYLGKTVHNGTAWDKSRDAIADDSFVAITPPKAVGSVKVQTTAGGGEYILANYNTTTGVTTALVTGGGCQISATDGSLNGTTGTDGYLTLRSYSTDGKIYIENRRGSSRTCVVIFE